MSRIMSRIEPFFLLFSLILFGCGNHLPESVGPAQEILVLADPADWDILEEPLREVFEKVIFTPQEEKIFQIQHGHIERLEVDKHFRRKNLLVAAPVDAPHPTADFLQTLLSSEVQASVRQGSSSVSWKEDVWAKGQLLIVLTGRTPEEMVDALKMESDRLYDAVQKVRDNTIRKLIYRYGERGDVSKELAQLYGWTVRVPFGYRILDAYPDSGFVTLAKEGPSRWLFVYWEDGIHPDRLTEDWCIQKRNEVTGKFLGGDRIVPEDVLVSQIEFAGKLAVTLQGLWENEEKWVGGPFKSYAFVDVDLGRFFLVDIGIYAPNKMKEPYLRQVDLMAQTFEIQGRLIPH